jgi:hypothetical protein
MPGTVKPGGFFRVLEDSPVGLFSPEDDVEEQERQVIHCMKRWEIIMKRFVVLGIVTLLSASSLAGQERAQPATSETSTGEKETKYLAFQIFTYGPNPLIPTMGEGQNPQIARFPDKATLRDYIEDIKRRIGTVGDQQTRLAVVLGHFSFDHGDAEITKFIELAFDLALETDVAVGFHIDDSMFWARRKDLWSDPNNVEALDWDGTPCTGRSLEWQTGPGAKADAAPPQMCFNSKVIQQEVRQRAGLLGKAIQAGVNRLQQLKRPELFAGVIAGSETMIGQDFRTGKYLGYRALLNRGFSRARPPRDLDNEREKVVQEFILVWTKGLADAGVSPQKIYSHTAFFPRRAFKIGGNKEITYSQHNNFAPPSVAFGKHHRPGFSTYPAPGRFDDIYEELAKHKQVGWASCEGTNLQLGSGPGQSGMTMETYLAKMFNHGATLVNIFSWGIGGEANKNMSFRVVTEGEEALRAYRKFLKGDRLLEAKTEALTLLERLPPKIHKIQKELPGWIQKTGGKDKAAAEKAAALMQQMQEQLKAKDFEEVEKTADSILKMMGVSAQPVAQDIPKEAREEIAKNLHGPFLVFRDAVQEELKLTGEQQEKLKEHLRERLPNIMQSLQSLEGLKGEEREKKLQAFRQNSQEKLTAVLNATLKEEQSKRLHQLWLQQQGAFALFHGGPEIAKAMKLTDEQRKQFVALVQELQTKIKPLIQEAQSGGNPEEIRPKVMKIRKEHERKIEALLTDAQKKQWKEMLGKPLDLDE